MDEFGAETSITTSVTGNFKEGDRITIPVDDDRPWWKRLWDWLLRRPKPATHKHYVITGVEATHLTMEAATMVDDLVALKLPEDLGHPSYCLHFDSAEGCTLPECDCREVDPDDDMPR